MREEVRKARVGLAETVPDVTPSSHLVTVTTPAGSLPLSVIQRWAEKREGQKIDKNQLKTAVRVEF